MNEKEGNELRESLNTHYLLSTIIKLNIFIPCIQITVSHKIYATIMIDK